MNTCSSPSSASCVTASSNRLCRPSAGRRYANCSGGNCWIGGNSTRLSAQSVSPMAMRPGMHDADHVAGKRLGHGLAIAAEEAVDARQPDLGRRAASSHTCMSFASRPEQTRRNATRSRWRGFMFAWILNTKPEKSGRWARRCASPARPRPRRRRQLQQRVQERLDAEVVHGRCRRRPASAARRGTPRGRSACRRRRGCPTASISACCRLAPISSATSGSSGDVTPTGAVRRPRRSLRS